MAHHKRRRPKNRRAGCLMCKPWKANGGHHPNPVGVERQLQVGREERREAFLRKVERLGPLPVSMLATRTCAKRPG
jgi:hypothetical protein